MAVCTFALLYVYERKQRRALFLLLLRTPKYSKESFHIAEAFTSHVFFTRAERREVIWQASLVTMALDDAKSCPRVLEQASWDKGHPSCPLPPGFKMFNCFVKEIITKHGYGAELVIHGRTLCLKDLSKSSIR